jgi:small-conductance mechanosensitive channel
MRALLLTLLLLLGAAAAQAQTPVTPPPGMTQQQFDALVDSIARSVADKLKAEAAPAAKPAGKGAPPAKPEIVRTPIKEGPGPFVVFMKRLGEVVRAYPVLGQHVSAVAGSLDAREAGGRGFIAFVSMLALVAFAAVLAESVLRRALATVRAKLAAGAGPEQGVRSVMALAGLLTLDAVGLLAVWLVCNASAPLFAGSAAQEKFSEAILAGVFNWRLVLLFLRLLLQPDTPAARLCDVSSENARALYGRTALATLVIILGRALGHMMMTSGAPLQAMEAYQLTVVLIALALLLWLVFSCRPAAQQWLGGLAAGAPVMGAVARHWSLIASLFLVALTGAQIYSVTSGRVEVGGALLLTLGLVIGLPLFETLMQALVRRFDSQLVGRTPASDAAKLPDVLARCVRVAVLIGVVVTIAEMWVVTVLALASPDQWDRIANASRTAGITLFLAFVGWELLKYVTEPYMARKPKNAADAIADGDAAATPASRLSTMMPLLRIAAGILIGFLAIMIVLEDFGVNVTPLIAGASIFGIAISFGSQTLVRDIVSGIFYLTDDAFRVGEYIDCGRAKGTVEGFTLRSIRLRHQNGQVHTIPFGQLGQITNFSRDWLTVKFNLRFARDTDIEKLRKAAKKIGNDMLEVPEIKAEVLAPFKMQGVADIVDNALLVRFKFTARPGNPAMIQREAVKRMFNTFPGLGIEFAKEGATVILHAPAGTSEAAPSETARAAAAA